MMEITKRAERQLRLARAALCSSSIRPYGNNKKSRKAIKTKDCAIPASQRLGMDMEITKRAERQLRRGEGYVYDPEFLNGNNKKSRKAIKTIPGRDPPLPPVRPHGNNKKSRKAIKTYDEGYTDEESE